MNEIVIEPKFFLTYLVNMVSALSFLWIGLYLLTRGGKLLTTLVAGCTSVLFSLYPLGNALGSTAATYYEFIFWQRYTWWTAPLALSGWFFLTTLILENEVSENSLRRIQVWMNIARYILIIIAGVFSVLGVISNLIYNYDVLGKTLDFGSRYFFRFETIMGPLHLWYEIFLVICVLFAILGCTYAYWYNRKNKVEESGLEWTLASAIVLAFGAMLSVFSYLWEFLYLLFTADIMLLVGLFLFSTSIFKYTNIKKGDLNWADFKLSLATVSFILVVFLVGSMATIVAESDTLQKNPKLVFLLTQKRYFNWTQFSINAMYFLALFMIYDHLRIYILEYIVGKPKSDLNMRLLALVRAGGYNRDARAFRRDVQNIMEEQEIRESFNRQLFTDLSVSDSHKRLAASPLQNLQLVKNELISKNIPPESASELDRSDALLEVLKKSTRNVINKFSTKNKATVGEVLKLYIIKGYTRKEIISKGFGEGSYDNYMNRGIEFILEEIIKLENDQKIEDEQ